MSASDSAPGSYQGEFPLNEEPSAAARARLTGDGEAPAKKATKKAAKKATARKATKKAAAKKATKKVARIAKTVAAAAEAASDAPTPQDEAPTPADSAPVKAAARKRASRKPRPPSFDNIAAPEPRDEPVPASFSADPFEEEKRPTREDFAHEEDTPKEKETKKDAGDKSAKTKSQDNVREERDTDDERGSASGGEQRERREDRRNRDDRDDRHDDHDDRRDRREQGSRDDRERGERDRGGAQGKHGGGGHNQQRNVPGHHQRPEPGSRNYKDRGDRGDFQGKGGKNFNNPQKGGKFNKFQQGKGKKGKKGGGGGGKFYKDRSRSERDLPIELGELPWDESFGDLEALATTASEVSRGGDPIMLHKLIETPLMELAEQARAFGVELKGAPVRQHLVEKILQTAFASQIPVHAEGIVELGDEGYGLIVYGVDNYKIKPLNTFVPRAMMERYAIKRGTVIEAQIHPSREGETTPYALKVVKLMGKDPEENLEVVPFEDLIPYYPTERILLETNPDVKWDNLSMRVVDMLTPVGFGQRGLIVAPPRTGKTILQHGIANAVAMNSPHAHLIILLIDERPEEVTDFRRTVKAGEVIASTFDEDAESHVHCAEMVIEKARRMVENGEDVVILLDSITRLARAYNQLMPNSGKILSGGVEANALQKPKRFFGSARNIEGGGSLTILGTALVETGSRMDEVIFEEFKGTGNMELQLDRALVDKRIFPAISLDRSGTRKEELLYHPDEMQKIYSLRRAMKGVPPTEAMEMLLQRVRKTKTNIDFLMGINR